MLLHGAREDDLLQVAALGHQVLHRVLVRDAHHVLLYDGTRVQLVGHVVARSADDLHATLVGGMVRLGPDEGRQERVVDVDDVVGIGIDHVVADDLHVARQDDEADTLLAQQFKLLLLQLLAVVLRDGEDVVGDAEALRHRLHVRVVADDERYVHVPLPHRVARQHVVEAVAHLGHEDGHARLHVGEIDAVRHAVLLRVERVEVVVNLLARDVEAVKLPLQTHEEDAVGAVDVLVEVEDVALVDGDETGHLGQDARAVGAV